MFQHGLLIEPQGIEIDDRYYTEGEVDLLIEPQGIEIHITSHIF